MSTRTREQEPMSDRIVSVETSFGAIDFQPSAEFDTDTHSNLVIAQDGDTVALFAAGSWQGVYRTDKDDQ